MAAALARNLGSVDVIIVLAVELVEVGFCSNGGSCSGKTSTPAVADCCVCGKDIFWESQKLKLVLATQFYVIEYSNKFALEDSIGFHVGFLQGLS
eukprot:1696360-Ditylum_brightwellii.AAC.1